MMEGLSQARQTLDIPEKASINAIQEAFRAALKAWHPDTCREDMIICQQKTRDIISAYKTILAYCNNYEIDFSQKGITKNLTPEEFMKRRFGNDPVWGNGRSD